MPGELGRGTGLSLHGLTDTLGDQGVPVEMLWPPGPGLRAEGHRPPSLSLALGARLEHEEPRSILSALEWWWGGTMVASVSPSRPVSAEHSDLQPLARPHLDVSEKVGLRLRWSKREAGREGVWGGFQGPPPHAWRGGKKDPDLPRATVVGEVYSSPRSCRNQAGGPIHSTSLSLDP